MKVNTVCSPPFVPCLRRAESVTDDSRARQKYTTNYVGNDMEIRIGDKNVSITGIHTYVLRYNVRCAVRFFHGLAKVYWNATGDGWSVPISVATATFRSFASVIITKTESSRGSRGSITVAQTATRKDGSVTFTAANIAPGDALTFAVGLRVRRTGKRVSL